MRITAFCARNLKTVLLLESLCAHPCDDICCRERIEASCRTSGFNKRVIYESSIAFQEEKNGLKENAAARILTMQNRVVSGS